MRFARQNIDHPLIDALVGELGLERNLITVYFTI
ncbi:Uncharacterised protein [Stutzerimonas stutzeri]|nr:Uncharacterised protein [Stutzerimonas stutzeri]